MAAPAPVGGRWRRRGLAAGVLLTASYVVYAWRGMPHGGTTMGLLYGILATAAILVLLYFGVRKRAYRSTWGTLEGWLQAHIYIGLLAAAVVLFHSGFRFHDRVAVAAELTLLVVVASGILGVTLYRAVPRRLSEVESELTPADLAAQLQQLAESMVRLASRRSPAFQQVCQGLLAETVPGPLAGWRVMLSRSAVGRRRRAAPGGGGAADGLGGPGLTGGGGGGVQRGSAGRARLAVAGGAGARGDGVAPWARHLAQVPAGEQEELRQLLVMSRQRGELLEQLVAQQHFRNLLAAWLYIHVPLSVALVVLVAAHLVAVFYFAHPSLGGR
jgi:hypothetical protein